MGIDILHLTIAVVSYITGILSGYFLAEFMHKSKKSWSGRDFVLAAVTFIWVTSRIVSMINSQYQTSPLIDGLMGALVGFFIKVQKQRMTKLKTLLPEDMPQRLVNMVLFASLFVSVDLILRVILGVLCTAKF